MLEPITRDPERPYCGMPFHAVSVDNMTSDLVSSQRLSYTQDLTVCCCVGYIVWYPLQLHYVGEGKHYNQLALGALYQQPVLEKLLVITIQIPDPAYFEHLQCNAWRQHEQWRVNHGIYVVSHCHGLSPCSDGASI